MGAGSPRCRGVNVLVGTVTVARARQRGFFGAGVTERRARTTSFGYGRPSSSRSMRADPPMIERSSTSEPLSLRERGASVGERGSGSGSTTTTTGSSVSSSGAAEPHLPA